ncbi:MAG: hypothetical protein KKB70_08965 [Proteobacteria bacterium]|nr:hypothetical protein [Pseudomonadota bacterium]MBU1610702.1 hypothetical protein [Pseudomonadota bacterium]
MLTPVQMFYDLLGQGLPAPGAGPDKVFQSVTDNDAEACVFCGQVRPSGIQLNEGVPWRKALPPTFNDSDDMGEGGFWCDMCRTASLGAVLPLTGNVLISGTEIVRFASADKEGLPAPVRTFSPHDIPKLMLNPPEPPFAWVLKTFLRTKAEHVIWKAKVSLSRDVFFVQAGGRSLYVDRESLARSLLLLRELLDSDLITPPTVKSRKGLFHSMFKGYFNLPKWARDVPAFVESWFAAMDDVPPEIKYLLQNVYPYVWAEFVSEGDRCEMTTNPKSGASAT